MIEDTTIVLDRSTLERWATCPAAARIQERGELCPASYATESGAAVHAVISEMVGEWISSRGAMEVRDLVGLGHESLLQARPDIQPDAIDALDKSLWPLAKWMHEIHPSEIIRYDGGLDDQSGQLAWEVDGILLTSELDFLRAGPSPEVLEEVDWKTGRAEWTAIEVAAAFQFRFHAWLVFQNYPGVHQLNVRVWNSRWREWTHYVPFRRTRMEEYCGQIDRTVQTYLNYAGQDNAPAWPAMEKCRICDAAVHCPVSGREAEDIQSDPGAFIDEMVALSARLDAMSKAAASLVDATGEELIGTISEARFGRNKPKSIRRPTAELY